MLNIFVLKLGESWVEGSIKSIRLKNFLTYDEAEISCGPNLNMVFGPNGTGKSSIVCALVLGLGGRPDILGRARELSDFVKHGKEKASVTITLKGKKGRDLIVRRDFRRSDNNSKWSLNGNYLAPFIFKSARVISVD